MAGGGRGIRATPDVGGRADPQPKPAKPRAKGCPGHDVYTHTRPGGHSPRPSVSLGTETAEAEATIFAVVEQRAHMTAQAQAETATAAARATGTVAAEQTAETHATGTAEAVRQAETRSAQETASAVAVAATQAARSTVTAVAQESATREAARNATATYQARRTATAAAQTATRAAQLALTAAVFSRQTEQARQKTAVAYQTSIAQPRIRCFEARRRHWEKSQAGGGEIAGIIYDRNGGRFSNAQVHLYIKASNLEWYLRPAADGIYTFCCLAYSMHNLHVVELVGNNVSTTRTYEFYINDLNQNKVLVDFYEVPCP